MRAWPAQAYTDTSSKRLRHQSELRFCACKLHCLARMEMPCRQNCDRQAAQHHQRQRHTKTPVFVTSALSAPPLLGSTCASLDCICGARPLLDLLRSSMAVGCVTWACGDSSSSSSNSDSQQRHHHQQQQRSRRRVLYGLHTRQQQQQRQHDRDALSAHPS